MSDEKECDCADKAWVPATMIWVFGILFLLLAFKCKGVSLW